MSRGARLPSTLITGGAGYIGSVLTRRLLRLSVRVRVLDLQFFGNGLADITDPRLESVIGDFRDADVFRSAVDGIDTVVHLGAVANDPSFDLDPALGRSINYDCLGHIFQLSAEAGVRRFVYASSASVYGVSTAPEVDERHPLTPLTDYNRYKAMGEELLFPLTSSRFETIAVRAATVCGVSPRQRLDLTVNLLTAQAAAAGRITVFGGSQYRPNIHIEDLVSVYERLVLDDSLGALSGQPLNVGNENRTVAQIAETVAERTRELLAGPVTIGTTRSDDLRSYRLTSTRLATTLGMRPRRSLALACDEICSAILEGRLPRPLADPRYYNVRLMKEKEGLLNVR
jgi:nucleoside-diphosphate-sugar epimerase